MFNSTSGNDAGSFQFISSILGLLLPILQIFFQFIPENGNSIFLFDQYFLIVSVFAAIVSYMLILIVRTYPWFQIPLFWQLKKQEKYNLHIARLDSHLYEPEVIREYLKSNPYVERPFYFKNENIFLLLVPIVLISFTVFFYLGLSYSKPFDDVLPIFAQSIAYIVLIAFTTLTLGIYHIREANLKNHTNKEKRRVDDALLLAQKYNSFEELPQISLSAQWTSNDSSSINSFVFKVNKRYYKITTDMHVNKILSSQGYDSYQDLIDGKGSV